MRKQQKKRSRSLNHTLLWTMTGGFSVMLLLLVVLDFISIQTYQKTNRSSLENAFYRYEEALATNIDELDSDVYSIYASDTNLQVISRETDKVEVYTASEDLRDTLYGISMTEKQVHGYLIFYEDLDRYTSYYNSSILTGQDMSQVITAMKEILQVRKNGKGWYVFPERGKILAICLCKRDQAALCMVYCLDSLMADLEQELSAYSADVFVVAGNQEFGAGQTGGTSLAADSGDSGITAVSEELAQLMTSGSSFSGMADGRYVIGGKMEDTSIWLCLSIPLQWNTYLSWAQIFLILLTVTSIIAVILIYRGIRKEMLRPLNELVDKMNRIADDPVRQQEPILSEFEELQLVDHTLDQMITDLDQAKNLYYEQTIEWQKAQLQYLSMQLKPHFYLNGLKTLNAMAMNGEKERVREMILRLSAHMRYILQLEKEMVLLKDEIDYTDNYRALRQDMTDRPITIDWDIHTTEQSWRVPTLCIQTFVENSCKYAKVGSVNAVLKLRITIDELDTEEGRFLDICIADNGAGYPEEVLKEINGEPLETSRSVGINNLKRRCRILYGEKAEYTFYNEDGAVSELILPWYAEKG